MFFDMTVRSMLQTDGSVKISSSNRNIEIDDMGNKVFHIVVSATCMGNHPSTELLEELKEVGLSARLDNNNGEPIVELGMYDWVTLDQAALVIEQLFIEADFLLSGQRRTNRPFATYDLWQPISPAPWRDKDETIAGF